MHKDKTGVTASFSFMLQFFQRFKRIEIKVAYNLPISQILAVFRQEVAFMKVSADYRMLALDALRGKWKTAVLTGIAASALGATIVSSSNSIVSNSN